MGQGSVDVMCPVSSCVVILRLHHALLSWQVNVEMAVGGLPAPLMSGIVSPVASMACQATKSRHFAVYKSHLSNQPKCKHNMSSNICVWTLHSQPLVEGRTCQAVHMPVCSLSMVCLWSQCCITWARSFGGDACNSASWQQHQLDPAN